MSEATIINTAAAVPPPAPVVPTPPPASQNPAHMAKTIQQNLNTKDMFSILTELEPQAMASMMESVTGVTAPPAPVAVPPPVQGVPSVNQVPGAPVPAPVVPAPAYDPTSIFEQKIQDAIARRDFGEAQRLNDLLNGTGSFQPAPAQPVAQPAVQVPPPQQQPQETRTPEQARAEAISKYTEHFKKEFEDKNRLHVRTADGRIEVQEVDWDDPSNRPYLMQIETRAYAQYASDYAEYQNQRLMEFQESLRQQQETFRQEEQNRTVEQQANEMAKDAILQLAPHALENRDGRRVLPAVLLEEVKATAINIARELAAGVQRNDPQAIKIARVLQAGTQQEGMATLHKMAVSKAIDRARRIALLIPPTQPAAGSVATPPAPVPAPRAAQSPSIPAPINSVPTAIGSYSASPNANPAQQQATNGASTMEARLSALAKEPGLYGSPAWQQQLAEALDADAIVAGAKTGY